MEIIDSRYESFKFALVDVIGTTLRHRLRHRGWHKPDVDFANLGW